MRRIWICAAVLLLLLASAASAEGMPMKVVNCKEWVSLRGWASTEAERLGKVPLGDEVELLGIGAEEVDEVNGEFCFVRWQDQRGYVLAKYLEPAKESDAYVANYTGDAFPEGLRIIPGSFACDLDGDGAEDAIEYHLEAGEYDALILSLNVNGASAILYTNDTVGDCAVYVADIDRGDGRVELLVHNGGYCGDYPCGFLWHVLRYDGTSLTELYFYGAEPYGDEGMEEFDQVNYSFYKRADPAIPGDGTILMPVRGAVEYWKYEALSGYEYDYVRTIRLEDDRLVVVEDDEFYPVFMSEFRVEDEPQFALEAGMTLYARPDLSAEAIPVTQDEAPLSVEASPNGWLRVSTESLSEAYFWPSDEDDDTDEDHDSDAHEDSDENEDDDGYDDGDDPYGEGEENPSDGETDV